MPSILAMGAAHARFSASGPNVNSFSNSIKQLYALLPDGISKDDSTDTDSLNYLKNLVGTSEFKILKDFVRTQSSPRVKSEEQKNEIQEKFEFLFPKFGIKEFVGHLNKISHEKNKLLLCDCIFMLGCYLKVDTRMY